MSPSRHIKGAWLPEDEHSTAASMTMRTALRTSSNRAAVRMLETVGIERAVSYAKNLGVGTVPERAVARARLRRSHAGVDDGRLCGVRARRHRARAHLHQARGRPGRQHPLPERFASTARVSETTAFLMATMLADVVDAGTANRARAMGFTLPAAGKTGTTNDFVDAWFVGFTPSLVAGVWVGFDTPRTIVKNGFAGSPRGADVGEVHESGHEERSRPSGSSRRAMWWPSRSAACRAACLEKDAATPRRSARRARLRTSRWCTPTTSCAAPSRCRRAPFTRPQYVPYPEPTFAEAAFDGLASLRSSPRCRTRAVAAPHPMEPSPSPAARPRSAGGAARAKPGPRRRVPAGGIAGRRASSRRRRPKHRSWSVAGLSLVT